MRIGYGKLGRSMKMNPSKFGQQGDPEAPQLLRRLALRNPDVEWVIVGRNDGYLDDMPDNVVNAFPPHLKLTDSHEAFEDVAEIIANLDGVVIHIGQHGTSQTPITASKVSWAEFEEIPRVHRTQPLISAIEYGGYFIEGMNRLGDRTDGKAPVVYICVDPRNFHKARDVKWPTGTDDILAQFTFNKSQRHERFRDPRTPEELGFTAQEVLRHGELWLMDHRYRQAGLELMILQDDWPEWGQKTFEERDPIGIASTSSYVPNYKGRRSWLINKWIWANFPDAPCYGRWDKRSLEDLPDDRELMSNTVEEFPDVLGQWRVTLSFPAAARANLGDQWSTAKPYQGFAARVVTFLMGQTDSQGYILPSRRNVPGTHAVAPGFYSIRDDWTEEELLLARWLRVETEDEWVKGATLASQDKAVWTWIVDAQRRLLQKHWDAAVMENTIEEKLGL